MRRFSQALATLVLSSLLVGCRGSLLLNPYAGCIDDVSDTHVYFDNWYCPRFDISRAGRPDWCGPLNSRFGRGICYLGSWDRYDEDNLYPPSNPYWYPGISQQAPNSSLSPTPVPVPRELPPAPSSDPVE